jgi:hypothetical protein
MNIRFALIPLVAVCLTACASTNSSNTKSLLSASGFSVKTPETAKQKELYAAAASYKVHRISANGKTMYAYKDEKTGTALIGDEAAYQRYERLSAEQSIARQQYQAAQMERETAMGWYGAYGPYYRSGPYYRGGSYYRY